ncbi:NepR family anti-sigma factor [Pseudoblastomonas halimionae]|uniref:Anti-sigma factor NepR domain-containing protein n=1 Tax=Alteriqipengyuania halimionae TaxID=1926630 RepID=A0A6I4U3C9_9SPHN|nr:NepR family anti-sigma factor [Alteriqipengyuania halimionae]MXP10520.1 hypothetical protein [Alteriqipengyuania halimionae]
MASKDTKPSGKSHDDKAGDDKKARDEQSGPEWARGLRDLYDDVVEEPLPSSFHDLLARLDEPKK